MKFTLEIDLDQIPDDKVAHELAHILRHWAGTLREHELYSGEEEHVYDSGYARVGEWRVTGERPEESSPAEDLDAAERAAT